MAYDNGRRVHKYYKMKDHKQRLKRRRWFGWMVGERDDWWQGIYVSGARKYAKNQTARANRSEERRICKTIDVDAPSDKKSTYHKMHEYDWEIW